MFIIMAVVFAIAFAWSFWTDPRRFANAILLLACLSNLVLSLAFVTDGSDFQIFVIIGIFMLFPLMLVIVSAVFVIAGVQAIIREGFSIPQMVSIVFGCAVVGSELAAYGIVSGWRINHFVHLALILYVFLATYVIFTFIALWLYSIVYQIIPRKNSAQFVIIHGAGLIDGQYVTPLLARRADKAIQVFDKLVNDDKYYIASGGQGSDEKISEAQAIKNYLVEKGVDPERIILEDRSTTTYENLLYSKEIMDARYDDYRVIFVTNDYHVFRTSIYARQVGLKKAVGVGCKTAFYYWPNAFVREYVAIIIRYKTVPVLLTVLWAALAWISFR